MPPRRRILATTGAALGTVTTAGRAERGQSGTEPPGGGGRKADIVAGPDGELAFEPESSTVSVREEVTRRFATPDHNVSRVPDHADAAELPDGAEPFATYDGDDRYGTEPAGSTSSHAFPTPGRYVHVCVPHITSGMVGELTVTE